MKPSSQLRGDRHLPQCYLSTHTSEHTSLKPQPDRLVLDLPTPEGWKATLSSTPPP